QRRVRRGVDLLDRFRAPHAVRALLDARQRAIADAKRYFAAAWAFPVAGAAVVEDVGSEGTIAAHGATDKFAIPVDAFKLNDAGRRWHFGGLECPLGCTNEGAFGFQFVEDTPQLGLVFGRYVEAASDVSLGAKTGILLEIVENHLPRGWFAGMRAAAHASSAVAFARLGFAAFFAAGFLVVVDVLSPVDFASAAFFFAGAFRLPFVFVEGAAAARASTSSIACSSVIEAGSAPRGMFALIVPCFR